MGEIIEVSGEDFRLEDMLAGNPQDELRALAAIRDRQRIWWCGHRLVIALHTGTPVTYTGSRP